METFRFTGPLAYHDSRWRRDRAPLLDHLGAVIDHVETHSRGGASDEANFVTSCNKCNTQKSDALAQDFSAQSPLGRVRGKYGEPEHWDGLSTLFIMLVEQAPHCASPTSTSTTISSIRMRTSRCFSRMSVDGEFQMSGRSCPKLRRTSLLGNGRD